MKAVQLRSTVTISHYRASSNRENATEPKKPRRIRNGGERISSISANRNQDQMLLKLFSEGTSLQSNLIVSRDIHCRLTALEPHLEMALGPTTSPRCVSPIMTAGQVPKTFFLPLHFIISQIEELLLTVTDKRQNVRRLQVLPDIRCSAMKFM